MLAKEEKHFFYFWLFHSNSPQGCVVTYCLFFLKVCDTTLVSNKTRKLHPHYTQQVRKHQKILRLSSLDASY